METLQEQSLATELGEYWDERAQSYSNGVVGELADDRRDRWKAALEQSSAVVRSRASAEGRRPTACDLGCGPGFFTILMNELGFQVSAVDASQAMVESAKQNVSDALVESDVSWHVGDLQTLPFPDNSFDFCACRNVTWLMRDPEAAYAEWLRVLKPGGTLAVYDANWYRYLVDEGVRRQREADMRENVLEGWDDDAQATSDEEKRCEELAAELPMTYALRPAWDVEALTRLGVSRCSADELAWQKVWSENEQRYYAATPTFLVEAVK